MNVDVGGSFPAPPFRMGFASWEPLLADRSLVGIFRPAVFGTKFAALFGTSWDLVLSRNSFLISFAAAVFGFRTLFAPTFVRLTFTFAAVIRRNHDGAKLRLNLGQLLDQCLGVYWHHWVQAIVFILNLDIRIAHQEATHGKRGH